MEAPFEELKSIAERLQQRKRRWAHHGKDEVTKESVVHHQATTTTTTTTRTIERASSRRRLDTVSATGPSPLSEAAPTQRKADIQIIKEELGDCKHHGTGNPLLVRSPTTPPDMAIQNLAAIIQNGVIGLTTTDSTPKLKTEVGRNGDAFWTNRVKLAGAYGWTGIILPGDTDSSKLFPMEQSIWLLVDDANEYDQLKSILIGAGKWESIQHRVVTVSQLANKLRNDDDSKE